jgi:Asp/Glu/hydantoin racemase
MPVLAVRLSPNWEQTMIRRIAVLHTVVFLAEMFRKLFQENIPNTSSFHMVDESIIQDLLIVGHLTPKIVRRIATHVIAANDTGVDLILFTCSSTSPAVDNVKELVDVPILKVDEPMAQKAVSLGEKIGVITTAKTTLEPSVSLIEANAAKHGKMVKVQAELIANAFEARLSGNITEHDRLVKETIGKLAQDNEVIVLAQASMAHLANEMKAQLEIPILASPSICIEALKRMIAESEVK